MLVIALLALVLWSPRHEAPLVIPVQVPQAVPAHCVPLSQAQLPTFPHAWWHPALMPPCPATTP